MFTILAKNEFVPSTSLKGLMTANVVVGTRMARTATKPRRPHTLSLRGLGASFRLSRGMVMRM